MTKVRSVETPLNNTMKTSTKRILALILTSALFALFGSSCGTVRGFGKDVEKTGEHIEDSTR
jgi:predicted small secreted protein